VHSLGLLGKGGAQGVAAQSDKYSYTHDDPFRNEITNEA